MNRTIAARLHDAIDALDEIQALTTGLSRSDFDEQRITQLLVERLLVTVGEAIARAEEADSELGKKIPEIRKIVGTRNQIVHGYWDIAPDVIWDVIIEKGPRLHETLQVLLFEYE